jgi:hypothetical protein
MQHFGLVAERIIRDQDRTAIVRQAMPTLRTWCARGKLAADGVALTRASRRTVLTPHLLLFAFVVLDHAGLSVRLETGSANHA